MTLCKLIFRLWPHFSPRRRGQFVFLLALTIFASFAELISLGSVIPFLSALSNPESILKNKYLYSAISLFEINDSRKIILWFTVIFCITVIFSGLLRLTVMIFTTRLSFAAGSDLSVSIYRKTLLQEYSVHLSRNSSEIIDGISTKANSMIYSIILPSLTLISSFIMLLAIFLILIYINPTASIFSIITFGATYIFIIKFTRNKKIINSQIISKQSIQIIKCLQEGLGGIRDVILDGSQNIFCEIYRKSDRQLRKAQENNQVLGLSPRYLIESMGMMLIAVVALYVFDQDGGAQNAIPLLGLFALSAQRLLPIMQQAYSAWSSIQGNFASLQDTLTLLEQPISIKKIDAEKQIIFKNHIKLVNVDFGYNSDNRNVIKNISFEINKGDRIGVIGLTGGGKSTLIDILMGLLSPTSGQLLVDNVPIERHNVAGWQKHIAHVPQSIFLSDTSIAENIAFGITRDNLCMDQVIDSAKKAQLDSVIKNLPAKYNSLVGERGVRLSGGQRQRIGIARALYKKADVLIFDEATSALDNDTEALIMDSIEALSNDMTIIMVAHRLTSLKGCNKIIELDGGEIVGVSSYEKIVNQLKD